jgi:hypothetical protein
MRLRPAATATQSQSSAACRSATVAIVMPRFSSRTSTSRRSSIPGRRTRPEHRTPIAHRSCALVWHICSRCRLSRRSRLPRRHRPDENPHCLHIRMSPAPAPPVTHSRQMWPGSLVCRPVLRLLSLLITISLASAVHRAGGPSRVGPQIQIMGSDAAPCGAA